MLTSHNTQINMMNLTMFNTMFTNDHVLMFMGLHPREMRPPYREINREKTQEQEDNLQRCYCCSRRAGRSCVHCQHARKLKNLAIIPRVSSETEDRDGAATHWIVLSVSSGCL